MRIWLFFCSLVDRIVIICSKVISFASYESRWRLRNLVKLMRKRRCVSAREVSICRK